MDYNYYSYLSIKDNTIVFNVVADAYCIYRFKGEKGQIEYKRMFTQKEIEKNFQNKIFDKSHYTKYMREINKHRLVYQLTENELHRNRNIFENYFYHNLYVKFPEEMTYRNGTYKQGYNKSFNEWSKWDIREWNFFKGYPKNIQKDIEVLKRRDPNFKYCLDKFVNLKNKLNEPIYTEELLHLFQLWKTNPECEFVIMADNLSLLNCKSFFSLSDKKKKEIIKYMNQHKEIINAYTKYQNIKRIIKADELYHLSTNELKEMITEYEKYSLNLSIEDYFYCKRQCVKEKENFASIYDFSENYHNYKTTCKKLGKNLADPYHRYPTNFVKRHNKVMEQLQRKKDADRERERIRQERNTIQRIKENEKKSQKTKEYLKEKKVSENDYANYIYTCTYQLHLKNFQRYPNNFNTSYKRVKNRYMHIAADKFYEIRKNYTKAIKNYIKYNTENFKGYKIFIPQTIEEIANQADILHQCLITCDYPKQVANGYCLLVFIEKDNLPYATVQLNKNAEIVQFHKDQDKNKEWKPEKELESIFDEWKEDKDLKLVA